MKKLVLFFSLVIFSNLKAAIIYTYAYQDIINSNYSIDFNGDAVTDFWISNFNYDNRIDVAWSPNYSYVQTTPSIGIAAAFAQDAVIGNLTWSNYSNIDLNFNFIQDFKYIGVKFLVGTNYYYGWIRVQVSSDKFLVTLYDYAFQDVPNMPLKAGEKEAVGLKEYSQNDKITVFPNPTTSHSILNIESQMFRQFNGGVVRNILGDNIGIFDIVENKIDLNNLSLSPGVYFLDININTDMILRKKIIID